MDKSEPRVFAVPLVDVHSQAMQGSYYGIGFGEWLSCGTRSGREKQQTLRNIQKLLPWQGESLYDDGKKLAHQSFVPRTRTTRA